MADEGITSGAGDDVARLVALTERQHELWGLLRDAKEENERNRLFDELTNNREELARLKDAVSAKVDTPMPGQIPPVPQPDDGPRSIGEQLRSTILSPETMAPSNPPPPPSPPATHTPPPPPANPPPPAPLDAASREEPQAWIEAAPAMEPEPAPLAEPEIEVEPAPPAAPEPAASPPREQKAVPESLPEADAPQTNPRATDHGDLAAGLAPEKTPYRSREADLAAMRGEKQSQASQLRPRPVADDALEKRRRAAHEAYKDMARVRPQRSRTWPIFAIIIAILAVAAVAWLVFFFDNGGDESTAPQATSTTTAAPEAEPTADQIQAVIDGMGVGSIVVEEREGTIYLYGSVAAENDRTAVVGASQALAGGTPVDATDLTLQTSDDDLRAAALTAVGEAGFDKINIAVGGGVATLTGVTPDGGADDLIAAVEAVDGIAQVVDLTEPVDRAGALENELSRVTAVTPLIFDSGQIDPDELHEQVLDRVAEIITAYSGPTVTIVSYTDASGSAEENEQISLVRAQRVRDYLVAQGVPAERLDVEGRGESGSSGSSAVAGLERRVEFEVGYVVAGGEAAFRIGIVAPSADNDLAFTQSIVDAANLVATEYGDAGVDVSDGLFVVDDAEAALRSYAADGYDLVIAHGSQYGTALSTLAQEFPNTAFAWGTAADTFGLDNVSSYEVSADEGGYVLGSIAASISDTGVVGVVGPIEVGDAQLFVNGFRNGVIATDPGADVLVTYTGSFSDVAMAADAASAHVGSGADVLTGSSQMVVGAVGVAVENDAAWFGNQANQTALAPDLVVASQVYHWEVALRDIIDGIDQGILGGSSYTLTLANGGVAIEYNDGYSLPEAVLTAAEEIQAGIIAGTVATGV